MPVSANKFNSYVQNLGRKLENLNADALMVMLTDTVPTASNAVYSDITQIASGGGYTTGGAAVGSSGFSQSGGLATLTGNNVVFTATSGGIAQFRYVVLYNSASANLIAWWDYGSEVTLASGDVFTVTWDAINGILTLQ